MAATIEAYKKWKEDNNIKIESDQIILPGLQFTEEQLWWISYGRTWCDVFKPNTYSPNNYDGVHAPNPARINGVAQNFQQFADAFKCPSGSPMNPKNKCGLWHN